MSRSNGIGISLWIYLILINGDVARGQTGGPNAVALINGQTMLDCSVITMALSSWSHTTDGTNNPEPIAVGCSITGNNAAYYRTEVIEGNICRLIIANATMQQAGVYNCYDGASTVYRSLVTVIDPFASVVVYNRSEVVDNDQLNISCSINYNGPASPAPSLRPLPYWTTSPGQTFTSATHRPSINVVTLVGTVTVQKPTVPIFQCNTVFEITGNVNGYNATPPPDNFMVGNTKQIDVQYSPSIPQIAATSSGFVACEAKNLTCSSDGNPPPNYNWRDSASGNVTSGQKIVAEFRVNYTCNASNIIRNVIYFQSSVFYETPTTNNSCKFPHSLNMIISGSTCKEDFCTCECSPATIVCYVDSYPRPSYEWLLPDGSRVEGQTVEAMISGIFVCRSYILIDGWYLVEAYRSINVSGCDFSVETTAKYSTENSLHSGSSASEIAAIVLGVVLAISITAHVFSIAFMYHKGVFNRGDSTELEVTHQKSNSEDTHYQDLSSETLAKGTVYEELHN